MGRPDYVQAARDGQLEFSWRRLSSGVEVTAEPVRLDGVIACVTAREAQQVADVLGVELTTPELEDAIWLEADVRLDPMPQPNRGDDWEQIGEQSKRIDRVLAERAGSGVLVAGTGKVWCPRRGENYGWHVPRSECSGGTWKGIKVHPCDGAAASQAFVIQPSAGEHNLEHVDYSQQLRLSRGGNVGRIDAVELPLMPLALPAIVSDPTAPHSLRSLAVCLAEAMRHGMNPLEATATSDHPDVERRAEYLSGAIRRDTRSGLDVAVGAWAAGEATRGEFFDWCAASQGWAESMAAWPGEGVAPWRLGVLTELQPDAASGRRPGQYWLQRQLAPAGFQPHPGALCIYRRRGALGHVDRIVACLGNEMLTLGGNEGPRPGAWRLEETRLDDPALLGWILDETPPDPDAGARLLAG